MNRWVTAQRCERCSKRDRCSETLDKKGAICRSPEMWQPDDTVITDRVGTEYIRIGTASASDMPELESDDGPAIAAPDVRSTMYDAMLRHLYPSAKTLGHFEAEQLRERRRLTPDEILQLGYWTHPSDSRHRSQVAAAVFEQVGDEAALGTPGFYRARDGAPQLAGPAGLAIPVRSTTGRIVGVRVRVEDAYGKRYLWLSCPGHSNGGGARVRAIVHVPMHDPCARNGVVRITEGEIKADIATLRTGTLTISIPGVAQWQNALPVLRELGARKVLLAFDNDVRSNRGVAAALQRLAGALSNDGFAVCVETWPERREGERDLWKGIDDLVTHREGGVHMITEHDSDAWQTISNMVDSAGATPDPMLKVRETLQDLPRRVAEQQSVLWDESVLGAAALMKHLAPSEFARLKIELKKINGAHVGDWTGEIDRRVKDDLQNAAKDGYALTDLGNVARLVAQHGRDLRHVAGEGWRIWDGVCWRRAKAGVTQKVAAIARELDRSTSATHAHWRRSESRAGIEAVVTLAETDAAIATSIDQFDANPWLLNVENGVIDLKTGSLRTHDRADMLTKVAPVTYDPTASAPVWAAFLERILPDADVRAFVQRFAGYACSGVVHEHVLMFLFGRGRNGKSTFAGALHDVLGDHAWQADRELLMTKPAGSHPTSRASLIGRRLVVCSEVEEGRSFNAALVKELTGGDRINARFMHCDEFSFAPTHKLMLLGNHRPSISDATESIWRRIALVEFGAQIPECEVDPALPEKLRGERSGILRWLVEGCLAWQRDGLTRPQAVINATREYREVEDLFGRFVSERCVEAPNKHAWASDLLDAYNEWLGSQGERYVTPKALSASLQNRDHKAHKVGGKKRYRGIDLRGEGDVPRDDGDDGDGVRQHQGTERLGAGAEVEGADLTGSSSPSSPCSPRAEVPAEVDGPVAATGRETVSW